MQNVIPLFSMLQPENIVYEGILNCQLFVDSVGQLRIKNPHNYLRHLEYYHVHKTSDAVFLAFDLTRRKFYRVNWHLPDGFKSIDDVFKRTGLYDTGVVIQRKKTTIVDVDLQDNWGFNLDICPGQEIKLYILSALAILNQKKLYTAVNTYNPHKTLVSNYQRPRAVDYDIPENLMDLFDRFLNKVEDYIFVNHNVDYDIYGVDNPSIKFNTVLQFFLDNVLEIDYSFKNTQPFIDLYLMIQWRIKNPKNNHPSNQLFASNELVQIYNIITNGNTFFRDRERLFKKIKIYHNPTKDKFSLDNSYYEHVTEFLQNSTTIKNFHKISKHLLNSKNTLIFLGESHIYEMSYFQLFLSHWRKTNAVQFKLMIRNLQNLQRFINNHSFYYPNHRELLITIDFTLAKLTSV